ncbi:MAG: hypothetical protein R2883_03775 [Caldisericia bacterium]
MHKITVEYLDSGDIETKTMNLYYGYEHKITFDMYEEAVVSIDSKIPANIWVGNIDVGSIPAPDRIIVHAGEREIKGELVGFGYRWKENRIFQTGDQIELQPGTDETHGALYIESETNGASFITSIPDDPMINNGSVFYPMVETGVVEIREQFTKNVVHYIDIYPGKVTKLKFIDDHTTSSDKTYKLENLKSAASTELFVDWRSGGVTKCIIEDGKNELTDLDIAKLTPFRATGLDFRGATKHFITRKDNQIGVTSFSSELPDSIFFAYSKEKKFDSKDINLMDVQVFSGTSPDGEYYYYEDGIIKADGTSYIALKSFIPGSWNMETGDVVIVGTASDCGIFDVKVESLLGKDPLYFPRIEVEDLIGSEMTFKRPQGFFLKDYEVLAVLGLPERTRIWKLTFDELIPIKDIPKGMYNSQLFDYRYLVCYPKQDSYSNGYIVDLQSGIVTANTEDIPSISILKNGNAVSGFNPDRVSAGVVYEWAGDRLIPIWGGLFTQ